MPLKDPVSVIIISLSIDTAWPADWLTFVNVFVALSKY